MLKAVNRVPCTPALRACRDLQRCLLDWLCDAAVTAQDLTAENLVPPRVPTSIEAVWLWSFLQRTDRGASVLSRAQALADLRPSEKNALLGWCRAVLDLVSQFDPDPPAWPGPLKSVAIADDAKTALKELMIAFYKMAFRSGLPYDDNGRPVATGGVTYEHFLQQFRDAHRANAPDICVLCGDELGEIPEIDHWLTKTAFPLLSVCGDNLLPSCGSCNSSSNKGERSAFSSRAPAFADWFHPYLRSGQGAVTLNYDDASLSIVLSASAREDAERARNLNNLLHLEERWSRKFRQEYKLYQDRLRKRIREGHTACHQDAFRTYLEDRRYDLLPHEPNLEVKQALFEALLKPARLQAWEAELAEPDGYAPTL